MFTLNLALTPYPSGIMKLLKKEITEQSSERLHMGTSYALLMMSGRGLVIEIRLFDQEVMASRPGFSRSTWSPVKWLPVMPPCELREEHWPGVV